MDPLSLIEAWTKNCYYVRSNTPYTIRGQPLVLHSSYTSGSSYLVRSLNNITYMSCHQGLRMIQWWLRTFNALARRWGGFNLDYVTIISSTEKVVVVHRLRQPEQAKQMKERRSYSLKWQLSPGKVPFSCQLRQQGRRPPSCRGIWLLVSLTKDPSCPPLEWLAG